MFQGLSPGLVGMIAKVRREAEETIASGSGESDGGVFGELEDDLRGGIG